MLTNAHAAGVSIIDDDALSNLALADILALEGFAEAATATIGAEEERGSELCMPYVYNIRC